MQSPKVLLSFCNKRREFRNSSQTMPALKSHSHQPEWTRWTLSIWQASWWDAERIIIKSAPVLTLREGTKRPCSINRLKIAQKWCKTWEDTVNAELLLSTLLMNVYYDFFLWIIRYWFLTSQDWSVNPSLLVHMKIFAKYW